MIFTEAELLPVATAIACSMAGAMAQTRLKSKMILSETESAKIGADAALVAAAVLFFVRKAVENQNE